MSSTNRNPDTIRPLLDTYHTPYELALYVTQNFIAPRLYRKPELILEPHCGRGAWVRAARRVWPKATIVAYDMLEEHVENGKAAGADMVHLQDFLKTEVQDPEDSPDLILGNPPYGRPKFDEQGELVVSKKTGKPIFEPIAHEHVAHACDLIGTIGGACFFLLNPLILTGFDRVETWRRAGNPATLGVLSPRPSFTGGNSDSVTYTMIGWGEGIRAHKPIETIYWREEKRKGQP